MKMGGLEVECQVHCYHVVKSRLGNADVVVVAWAWTSAPLASVGRIEPSEQQEDHLASLSHRQNLPFFSDFLSGEEGFGTKRYRFSSLFIFFTHSLTLMLSVVYGDVFSTRKTPKYGKPGRYAPCPQVSY